MRHTPHPRAPASPSAPRASMVALISRLGACVPVYDFHTARKYAEIMLNAQIILCACGSLSWAFGGVASLTFGFALLAHVGLEVAKPKLLKMYTVSQFALLLLDVIWLSLWARRIDRGAVRARESSIFPRHAAEMPPLRREARHGPDAFSRGRTRVASLTLSRSFPLSRTRTTLSSHRDRMGSSPTRTTTARPGSCWACRSCCSSRARWSS